MPGTCIETQNAHSLTDLFLPLSNDLYRVALGMCRNTADADDLMQDTYLRARKRFHQFRDGSSFRSWIFTVLRSAFIDSYRKRKRGPSPVDHAIMETDESLASEDEGREIENYLDTDDDQMLADCFRDDVRNAVFGLPGDFRKVLLLTEVAGFKYDQVARLMGCPLGTVRSRLSRAKCLLREAIGSPD